MRESSVRLCLQRCNKSVRQKKTDREHISVGDATIASDDGKTVAFVYLGGADFLYIDNVTGTCSIVSMTDSPYEASNILVTFFAYDRYVTIRPSMR